jgi:hypothetical protein
MQNVYILARLADSVYNVHTRRIVSIDKELEENYVFVKTIVIKVCTYMVQAGHTVLNTHYSSIFEAMDTRHRGRTPEHNCQQMPLMGKCQLLVLAMTLVVQLYFLQITWCM